jgi:type II secretory pathway pseudopilin PulG
LRYTEESERCAGREAFICDGRGITLIELGVALGILVLLMAIAVPVFSAVRRQREMAGCALNLKSIGAALRMYWEDWGGFPVPMDPRGSCIPDTASKPCDLWKPPSTEWEPPSTECPGGVAGLGLYTLYYFYINPDAENPDCQQTNGALYTLERADYLRSVNVFNCPANPVKKPAFTEPYDDLNHNCRWDENEPFKDLNRNGKCDKVVPYLGGFDNYDWFYQRAWGWDSNCQPSEPDDRNLLQPFPPDDTVVTWCPMHRNAAPEMPTAAISSPSSGPIHRSDWDLVLWVDGTVERLRSQSDQHLAEPPEK